MRIDSCLQKSALLAVFAVISGCQLLQSMESGRRLEHALEDNKACEQRGYEFPGEAYTECRLDLQDQRLRRRWSELQLSTERQLASEPGSLHRRETDAYRPLQLEDYRCELRRTEDGGTWVDCFETGTPQR